jgi:hypothetical protein
VNMTGRGGSGQRRHAQHLCPARARSPCLCSCPLPRLQTEKHLSELVVSKAVAAKIDRPAGLVQFGARQVR